MPIDVICPKCQSKLRAPDEVAGKNVRCKKCQERFKVPNPGAAVDSVGDTQQLSVMEMPTQAPKPPAPAEPMMLDDSAFDDPIPAPVKAPVPKPVAPAAADPFSFTGAPSDEDDDRPKKKKKKRADDEEEDDRPKKKKKRDEDDDEDEDRPKKKKEKPLIGGEPTFAMPGAAEDPAPVSAPVTAHVGQFSFEEPTSAKGKKRDRDDEDDVAEEERPKKKQKRADDEEDDERPKSKGKKKPVKSKKTLYILLGIAMVLLLGCGGAAAAGYYFVYRVADGVSKATVNMGTPTTKEEAKAPPTKEEAKAPPTKGTGKEPPVPGGGTLSEFTLPAETGSPAAIVGMSDRFPLAFDMSAARQVRYFNHPLAAKVVAIFRTQTGTGAVGSEDTVAMHALGIKQTTSFTVSGDGIAGPRIFDISDFGSRVAIEAPAGRLTVYDADTKSKVFDGFDVHAGRPDRQGIAAIAFGDDNGETVAVVDRTGAVDVWKVKERERSFTGTVPAKPSPVAVEVRKRQDAGGLIASKDGFRQVTWETGAMTAAVALPPKSGTPTVVASHKVTDTKTRVAFAHKPEGGKGFEVWVVERAMVPASGPTVAAWRIAVPADAGAPTSLLWSEYSDALMIGFGTNGSVLLCDWKSKTVAAYLKAEAGKTLIDSTGGAWLTATPDSMGKATAVLAGKAADQATVSSRVAAYAEDAQKKKQPRLLLPKPEGLGEQ